MSFPPGEVRFVADITVGKAAKWLRILGFDTHFMRTLDEGFLARCLAEGRVFITRDSRLAVKRGMTNALLLTADDAAGQLADILCRLRLLATVRETVHGLRAGTAGSGRLRPLSRCIRCNEPLAAVSRDEVVLEVPDFTWVTQERFERCPACRRVYWAGTHRERMMAALERLGLDAEGVGETPGG